MAMLKHLNNLDKFNTKKEFSFNLINAAFKFDDFYMNDKTFLEILSDQDIQFISDKVTREDKLEQRQ